MNVISDCKSPVNIFAENEGGYTASKVAQATFLSLIHGECWACAPFE